MSEEKKLLLKVIFIAFPILVLLIKLIVEEHIIALHDKGNYKQFDVRKIKRRIRQEQKKIEKLKKK